MTNAINNNFKRLFLTSNKVADMSVFKIKKAPPKMAELLKS